MSFKVSVKSLLGISKPIEIKTSNKNMRKAMVAQKEMLKINIEQTKIEEKDADELTEEDTLAQLTSTIKMQDVLIDFLTDVLNLDDEQSEKLEDVSFDKTMELYTKITSKILGVEPAENTEEEKGLEA